MIKKAQVNEALPYDRIEMLERRADEMERRFTEAFPAGDHLGHRAYHDMMIEEARDRKKLIAAVKEKTIGGLVWAGVIAIGLSMFQYVKAMLK